MPHEVLQAFHGVFLRARRLHRHHIAVVVERAGSAQGGHAIPQFLLQLLICFAFLGNDVGLNRRHLPRRVPQIGLRLHALAQVRGERRIAEPEHEVNRVLLPHALRAGVLHVPLAGRRDDVEVDGGIHALLNAVDLQAITERRALLAVFHGEPATEHIVDDGVLEHQRLLGTVRLHALDLLLDLLLFVRQVLVDLAFAAHICFAFQGIQRTLDRRIQIGDVRVKAVSEQDAQVVRRRLEAVHVAHEQERLEQAHAHVLDVVVLGTGGVMDAVAHRALHRRRNAVIEAVERHERADCFIIHFLERVTHRGEHGTGADGRIVAAEHIVLAHLAQRFLEQRELIVDERIVRLEIVRVIRLVGGELRRSVRELEHRAQIRVLLVPQRFHLRRVLGLLHKQPLLDHLDGIRAAEFDLDLEAPLDLGEIVALLLAAVAHHGIDVFLRRHDDPGAALRVRGKRFRDRLQRQHELGVVAHELAHLIDEEHDPQPVALALQPLVHVLGEIIGSDDQGFVVRIREVLGGVLAGGSLERFPNFVVPQERLLAPFLPALACDAREGILERPVPSIGIEVLLELRHRRQFAEIATRLVEHPHKRIQQRLVLVGGIRLLVDVEQHRCGWDAQGTFERPGKQSVLLLVGLGNERAHDVFTARHMFVACAIDKLRRHLAEDVGQHLEQMRFAGTEETGNPRAVLHVVHRIVVDVKEFPKVLAHLVRQHIFVDFLGDVLLVACLDDAVDGTVDVFGKQLAERDAAIAFGCALFHMLPSLLPV